MKTTALGIIIGFIVGLLSGFTIYSVCFCADTNDAIIEQLAKDSKKVDKIKEKEVIRYVQVEKVKTVIETVVDTTGCADVPNYELGAIVFDALNIERPKAD